jgi:hypothetical protein
MLFSSLLIDLDRAIGAPNRTHFACDAGILIDYDGVAITARIHMVAKRENLLGAGVDAEFAGFASLAVDLYLWHSTSLLLMLLYL